MKALSQPSHPRGQSLVEMAITITLLLTLLIGLVDMGMGIFSWITLRDAAQEGALIGSVDPTNTAQMLQRIQDSSTAPIDWFDANCDDGGCFIMLQPTYTLTNGTIPCGNGQNAITVTLIYQYQLVTPFLSTLFGTDIIPLRAAATDTILTPRCP